MMSKKFMMTFAMLVIGASAVTAQGTAAVNPVYRRAQTLVNDGNAAAGRALIDSMIGVAAAGSNEYAEAVYWRAVLASTAAEAEMDYRRVVVDYPLSPRVEDALIRLAQLELARGNYDGALRHLNRLATEHPQSPARARAGYWTARALFDKNDVQGGCAATADALSRTTENDTELRNQISYLNQRCAGIVIAGPATGTVTTAATAGVTPAAPAPAPPSTLPDTTMQRVIAAAPITPAPITSAPVTRPSVDSARAPVVVPAPTPERVIPPAAPAPRSQPVTSPATTRPTPARTTEGSTAPSSTSDRAWSVQVAAYNVKSQADAMVTRLKKGGYEARVDGTAAPFRVRIGRYESQSQAAAVQRSLKAKQITGFVVQADTR